MKRRDVSPSPFKETQMLHELSCKRLLASVHHWRALTKALRSQN